MGFLLIDRYSNTSEKISADTVILITDMTVYHVSEYTVILISQCTTLVSTLL